MKIKERVLRFTHNRFCWCYFSSVYKGYHFALLILSCRGIKYEIGVILWTHYFRRFCDLSPFIEPKFGFMYEIIFIRFSWRFIFLNNLQKRKHIKTFRLCKYVNILQLSIADIAAVLYVACKCLFALSLDSPFLLYILLYILGKWKPKLNHYFHN